MKLSNADDIESVYVNGTLRGSAGYNEYVTFGEPALGRLHDGDVIEVSLCNSGGGYSWGIDILVDGVTVYHDWAGTVTSYGANENDGSTDNPVHDIVYRVGAPLSAPPPDESGLSSEWCGGGGPPAGCGACHERLADLEGRPYVQLVYARPSDFRSHFGRYSQLMQSDVQAADDKLLETASAAQYYLGFPAPPKEIRFATGTRCGAQYLRIASVRLTKPLKYWRSGCARGTRVFAAAREIKRIMERRRRRSRRFIQPRVNYLIYADGFFGGRCLEAGVAQRVIDPRASAQNRANRGDLIALVEGGGADSPKTGPDDFASGQPVWFRRDTLLHEVMHNLGAVLSRAPHATGLGHCTDGPDIMCYDDGGTRSWQTFVCGDPSTTLRYVDCNWDDYFNPVGDLLDWRGRRMWNVYDSVFLCYVANCATTARAPRQR